MKISKKLLAVIIVIAFFVGGTIGASGNKVVTKTQIKEVIKTQVTEVCRNEAEWKQMKLIDDKIFSLAGDGMIACGSAIGNTNLSEVLSINEEIKNVTAQTDMQIQERKLILRKLGY
jgi:hypothetical protein